MIDRAIQALYHFSIDPVVETKSDPNSFGFRKNRSTHDAIIAIRSHLDKKTAPQWILEIDISKCFDKINHGYLMKETPIAHKNVLKEWLECGIIHNGVFSPTTEGTPQGGIISPTLCNIALNGLEEHICQNNPKKKGISPGVHLIRYADDMIITGKNKEICLKNKELVEKFLKERGLELNEKKTKITHIREGFDFLGFNIRRMGIHPRMNNISDQDTVLIIKPSQKGIEKLKESITRVITQSKPLIGLIRELNPILRGWANHKCISYHSQSTFIRLDHIIYEKMMKWVRGRGKWGVAKANKYLVASENRKWNWGIGKARIVNLGETAIISPRPLKLDRNPYLMADEEYFNKRKARSDGQKFRSKILKKYNYTCDVCGQTLLNEEKIDFHHIKPRKSGGRYTMKNIKPLHQICHQRITYGTAI